MYEHDGWMWFGGVGMWLFWLLLIAVVVIFFRLISGNDSSGESESPLDILKKRYARGEIDEEEYHRRKKELESG